MKRKRFTEEQIIGVLKESEVGAKTDDVCQSHGISSKRRKLTRRDRVAPQVPERPMQLWSLVFVSDQLADYRRFRVLNIVDDHSRFCPGQIVDVSIPGARVARFLDDLAIHVGLQKEIILPSPDLALQCPAGQWTTALKAPARPCSTGQSGLACVFGSSSRTSRSRTLSPRFSSSISCTFS